METAPLALFNPIRIADSDHLLIIHISHVFFDGGSRAALIQLVWDALLGVEHGVEPEIGFTDVFAVQYAEIEKRFHPDVVALSAELGNLDARLNVPLLRNRKDVTRQARYFTRQPFDERSTRA